MVRTLSRQSLAHLLAAASVFIAALPATAALPTGVSGIPMPSLAPMLKRVLPAVVSVNTKQRVRVNTPFGDDPVFRRMFGIPQERIAQSLGSGVIVDAARGLVLTNNHVVEDADEVSLEELPEGVRRVDAADVVDLGPRDRLPVGDDGQHLEGRAGEALRPAAVEDVDVVGVGGTGPELPAAGDGGELEPARVLGKAGAQALRAQAGLARASVGGTAGSLRP